MTTNQAIARYGTPNETGRGYLKKITLPYPMKLSWDTDIIVTKMSCHTLVADKFINTFEQILDQYTLEGIQALGIDIFGGCFNYRRMRNGTSWSKHSWGIAIDLDPINNRLKWDDSKASFAHFEYTPMIDIFEHNGFVSLGREKGYDFMHFEVKE